MTIPVEEFNAVCATAKRLERFLSDGKKITKDDVVRLLRHYPGPTRTWMIFEGNSQGQVSKDELEFWANQK